MRRDTLHTRTDRLARYVELGGIVARSGLWRGRRRADESDRGRSLRQALEQAGGIYVKLGQLLSTRPDLIPSDVVTELRFLQQDAPPVSGAAVHRLFVEELGRPPAEVLHDFDTRPVAAASVAQVHRGRLADGAPVAVKVQRPDVAARVARDLDILGRLAARLERHTGWAAEQRLAVAVQGFADSVTEELDFRVEARNLRAIADAVGRHDRIVVPAPVLALSRRRVLVMEWIEGRPLSSGAAGLAPDHRRDLARSLLHCFFEQIFTAGVFHADPHPGNLHLTTDGRIALLDCGAVGRLTPAQQAGLRLMCVGIAARDGRLMAAAVSEGLAGPPQPRPGTRAGAAPDGRELAAALDRLVARHLRPGSPPDLALFAAFSDVLRRFGLTLEPVVLGAIRALATVQSTVELLAPDLDLLDEARVYGEGVLSPAA